MSRRKQLIWKNTAISLGVVLAVSAVYLALQRKTEQYSPGETMEGITSELERKLPEGRPAVRFVCLGRFEVLVRRQGTKGAGMLFIMN